MTGGGAYDILLVVGAKKFSMGGLTKIAHQLKLPEEKLLGDWIVCIPGFTLEKYRKLQRSRLSIFAPHCFGGFLYHTVALTFRSPFINLWLDMEDYIRFLRAPRVYIEEQVTFKETRYDKFLDKNYPVTVLGNIEIHMNHYRDFDEAVKIWTRRKERINWYNLFVMMYTDSEEILQKFDALPYGKKVCFVPFKSDLDSAWYINPEIDFDRAEEGFYDVVNNFARGKIFYYDVFDMLLYGKKTPLIEM